MILAQLRNEAEQNAKRLREIADGCHVPEQNFILEIEYENGEQTPLELTLNRWRQYGQWRFKLFQNELGFAAAYVKAEGTFVFGRHRHPVHETYIVRKGVLMDDMDDKQFRLTPGSIMEVPSNCYHAPEVISEGCQLYIEWRW